MSEIQTTNTPIKFNLDAHYTTNTKLERPKPSIAQAPATIPKMHLFSDNDANKRMKNINNDIYIGTNKEKSKNEFNKSLFLKIFAVIGIAVTSVACFSKLKNFFRKS